MAYIFHLVLTKGTLLGVKFQSILIQAVEDLLYSVQMFIESVAEDNDMVEKDKTGVEM